MNLMDDLQKIFDAKIIAITSLEDPLMALLTDAKAGKFNQLTTIPYSKVKAEALKNPKVRAEYERLRPEFEPMITRPNLPPKKETPRRIDGKRKYLMDYIHSKPLYAAVMFARKKIREGESPDYAIGWAARLYAKHKVKKHDIARYVGQSGGTVSGRRR